jgi:hypothetical protein
VAWSLSLCGDPSASIFEDCYLGSESGRVIGTLLIVLGVISAGVFLISSISFFSKSRRPMLVLLSGIAAVLLLGIGMAVI